MDFDLTRFGSLLGQLLASIVLALPIAWERERSANSAGLRTFPIVAAASCVYVLLGIALGGGSDDAESRILQGLMTGIGFVGGGAILKMRHSVHGTATAASIWMTGALGAAVGYRQWEMALAISLLTFASLQALPLVRGRHTGAEADEESADVPP